jgi:hypothetical protein
LKMLQLAALPLTHSPLTPPLVPPRWVQIMSAMHNFLPPAFQRGSQFPDGADAKTGDEDLPFHLAGYAPLGSKTPARGEDDKYAACSTPQSINVDALKRPGVSGVRAMFEGGSKQEAESKGKKEGGGKAAEDQEAAPMSLKERMAALEKGKSVENEVRSQAQS